MFALIPTSAHGTNPASAVMVGMKVQKVKCDEQGKHLIWKICAPNQKRQVTHLPH